MQAYPLLFLERIALFFFNKIRFMDEVIGMTNGDGCGNRIKSGTPGYLLF
jgi:hypothetical protein